MKAVIFFVALCMVLLFTTQAALSVTPTFDCAGTDCAAGQQGDLTLVLTHTVPSTDLSVIFAVPSNSTISGDCYQVTEAGAQTDSELPYSPINLESNSYPLTGLYSASNPASQTYYHISVSQAKTPLRIRCRYTMAPVEGDTNLKPYSLGTTGSYPIGVYQQSVDSTLETSTVKFVAPVAAVSTQPNIAKWSAGRGASGQVIFQLFAPFSVSPFDKISLSGFTEPVTNCYLGGLAERITETGYDFIALNGAGPGEDGYISFSCDLTVPSTPSGYPKNVTIKVYRMYWANPEQDPTGVSTLRYSLSASIEQPPEAVIGAADASISLYPNSYIAGGSYRVLFETSDFNTVLSYTTTTGTDDAATVTTRTSKLTISLELGQNFLIADTVTPRCSWSLSARDFNLYSPDLGATTSAINNNIMTWTFVPSTQLTSTTGKTVRFACTGLKLDPNATIDAFPYKPQTEADADIVGTIIAYALGGSTVIAENKYVEFTALQETSQGGVELTYAKHVLKLKNNSLLSKQEIERLIEVYRSVLELPSTVTISVSTQILDASQANVGLEKISGGVSVTVSNDLSVYVFILGNSANPSADISTKLNAAAATSIANTLTSDFGLSQLAAQSSAQTYITPAHCNNKVLDTEEGELGIDCGGNCLGCPSFSSCSASSDCVSGSCSASTCASLVDNSAVPISTFVTLSIAVITVISTVF